MSRRRGPACVRVRGPLDRAALPALYSRACAVLAAHRGRRVVCLVDGVRPDAVAVEALARLRLGALRHGCAVEVRTDSRELVALIAFAGLADALRPALTVQVGR